MKSKHLSMAIMVLSIFTIVFSCLWLWIEAGKNISATRELVKPLPLSEIQLPPPEVLADLERLEGLMDQLGKGRQENGRSVDLSAFGYEALNRNLAREGKIKGRESGMDSLGSGYNISFAFSSPSKGFCVVDGEFYEQGTLMQDGTRILKVRPDSVLMERAGIRKWVPVRSVHEALVASTDTDKTATAGEVK